MNKELFSQELKKLNIELTEKQKKQLDRYYDLVVEWNQKINLTRILEKEEFYLKHFYDSITLSKIIDLNQNLELCDLGSGAGFPGIVLKIVFPNLNITLVDSLNKRINFLKLVIEDLKLDKIRAVHARIEDFAVENREKYDIVTARAVAPLNTLLELGSQLVKLEGYFISMKGNISQEIKNAANAIKLLEFKLDEIQEFNLPIEESNRSLVKLRKIKKTPKLYPRKMEKINKTPL